MPVNRTLVLGELTFVATGEFAPTPEEHNAAYAEVCAIRERASAIEKKSRELAEAARDAGNKEMRDAHIETGRKARHLALEAHELYHRWVQGTQD